MKKLHLAILLLLVAGSAFVFSCKTTRITTQTGNTNVDTIQGSNQITCVPIILDTEVKLEESHEFLLVNAELSGKCLMIEVEYTGGCGGDQWTLLWNGMLMKSLPPKANIWLHLKNEDACRSVVRKKLFFDISSVYNGEVVIFLKDFRGELRYQPN